MVAVLAAAASPARAALPTSIVGYGPTPESDGSAGQLYTPANSAMTIEPVDGGGVEVRALTPLNDASSVTLAPPAGYPLAPGVYDGAREAPYRSAGQPLLYDAADDEGGGCTVGRFEIKDVGRDAGGAIDRLWAIFQARCGGDGSADHFGEVRYGEPAESGAAATAPAVVRWPDAYLGFTGETARVTLVAASAAHPRAATVAGPQAGDFPIVSDGCAGRSLAAGATCVVTVRFVPGAAGADGATLRIPGDGGELYSSDLQGFARGGRTRIATTSDTGDPIGQGGARDYERPPDPIAARGTGAWMDFDINRPGGEFVDAEIVPPSGSFLTVGAYPGALRTPYQGTKPGIDVGMDGRGCNTLTGDYTIRQADYDADGYMAAFAADFTQHCEGAAPALHGTLELAGGDHTPPAPWMDPSPAPAAFGGAANQPPRLYGSPPAPASPPSGDATASASPASAPAADTVPASPPLAAAATVAAAESRAATARTSLAVTPARATRRDVLRRGLRVAGVAAAPGPIALTVNRATMRRLGLHSATVGHGRLQRPGAFATRVALTAAARRALTHRAVAVAITVTAGAARRVVVVATG